MAILALRWLADASSAWWIGRRLAADGLIGDGPTVVPRPRNPFTETPRAGALRLFEMFAAVAVNSSFVREPLTFGGGVAAPATS